MDNIWSFRDRLIKVSAIVICIVSVFSMSAMIAYAKTKTVITDNVELEEDIAVEADTNIHESWIVDLSNPDNKLKDIVIPCPSNVSRDDVLLSTRYDTKEISLSINVDKNHYFLANPVRGKFTGLNAGRGFFDGEKVTFTFTLVEPCECEVSYINGEIGVRLIPLNDINVPFVMIDPFHGGTSLGTKVKDINEKDINLAIALKVKELSVDKEYKVLLTRDADNTMSVEDRLSAIENTKADYYIGIHLDSDAENVKAFGMGAVYNAQYYRNGIQNADYAVTLLNETVNATSNKGVYAVNAKDQDVILKVLDIPAVNLSCGYMSNADELSLLLRNEYVEKIAEGIVSALDNIIVNGSSR